MHNSKMMVVAKWSIYELCFVPMRVRCRNYLPLLKSEEVTLFSLVRGNLQKAQTPGDHVVEMLQCTNHCLATIICWTLVMAPKSVTFRRHDHLVSVLFGDLLSHSYNITFSMFLDLVTVVFADFACHSYQHDILETFLYLVHLLFGRCISYNCVCSSG